MPAVRLLRPSLVLLPEYAAALERGWSPNTTRDVSGEQLKAIAQDAPGFVADLVREEGGGMVTVADGTQQERLPGRVCWIWDDAAFCGAINLRFRPGTLELPPHVSGHVGYAVVPWKRGRGVATAALRLMLGVAGELGLPRVLVTCDVGNEASARVILANGGVESGVEEGVPGRSAIQRRLFWVATTE